MDPELKQLYEAIRGDIQAGRATPQEAAAWLSSNSYPDFQTLGKQYAETLAPTREEVAAGRNATVRGVGAALGDVLTTGMQALTLGTADDVARLLDPGLGAAMEESAQRVQSEHPIASIAAGLLSAGGAPASLMMRGGAGLFARAIGGGLLGAAEGGVAGFGYTPSDDPNRARNTLIGAGVGAGTGGLGTMLTVPAAAVRRSGVGSDTGTRLAGRLVELTEGIEPPFYGGATGERTASALVDRARPTMRGRLTGFAEQTRLAGEQTFGRLDGVKLVPTTSDFLEEMRGHPVTGPLINNIKRRVQTKAGQTQEWTFAEARQLHRRLKEMARMKATDPKSQADTETIKAMADQLEELLDASTGGLYSEANRLYSRTAEVEEAYRLGAGMTQREGLTELDPLAAFSDTDRLEVLLESWRRPGFENPAADEAFRAGLRDNFVTQAIGSEGQRWVNVALEAAAGRKGDYNIMRALFPAGTRGDRQYAEWLQTARLELGTERLTGLFERGSGVAGRAGLVRGMGVK